MKKIIFFALCIVLFDIGTASADNTVIIVSDDIDVFYWDRTYNSFLAYYEYKADADYKIFLVASLEERAKRRYKELLERGENADLSQVKEDMRQRDHNDSTRKYNPLKQAEDAILIDSTGMGINQVVDKILKIIKER